MGKREKLLIFFLYKMVFSFLLKQYIQRRKRNPVKHLRWSIL